MHISVKLDYYEKFNIHAPIINKALNHYSSILVKMVNDEKVGWNPHLKKDLLAEILQIPSLIENIKIFDRHFSCVAQNKELIVACLERYLNDIEMSVKYVEERLMVPQELSYTEQELNQLKEVIRDLASTITDSGTGSDG